MFIETNYDGLTRIVSRSFSYHLNGYESKGIKINGLGLQEQMKPCWNKRGSGNSDFLLLYFYDPVLFQIEDNQPEEIEKKWIIVSPGTSHSYGNSNKEWNHSWFHFDGSVISDLIKSNDIPLDTFTERENPYLIEQLLHRLNEEIYFYTQPDFEIINLELSIFFRKLHRSLVNNDSSSPIPAFILKTKKIIDFQYANTLSLREISNSVGFSPQYLSKNFKMFFNVSPIEYLIEKRIQVAKRLLTETSLPIHEISNKVGYSDFYYFSKLFKRRTKYSPRAYRKILIN
jgi:AraC-like DNA-binding protein